MAPTLEINPAARATCELRDSSPVKASSTFQSMLDKIELAFSRNDNKVDIDELWQVLENYKSNQADWKKYAFYDEKNYKRNLVAEYEKYNVMIICWAAGSSSCIHNHSGAHCFMKILDGDLIESRFSWPEEKNNDESTGREMTRIAVNQLSENKVLYINDHVGLHQVENPSKTKPSVSLHVYIPPYRKCKAFDYSTGRSKDCKLTFFSEHGQVTGEDEKNPWSQ